MRGYKDPLSALYTHTGSGGDLSPLVRHQTEQRRVIQPPPAPLLKRSDRSDRQRPSTPPLGTPPLAAVGRLQSSGPVAVHVRRHGKLRVRAVYGPSPLAGALSERYSGDPCPVTAQPSTGCNSQTGEQLAYGAQWPTYMGRSTQLKNKKQKQKQKRNETEHLCRPILCDIISRALQYFFFFIFTVLHRLFLGNLAQNV